MKLIIGLGNPGKEYDNTRHNIGFMFIDYYLNKKGIPADWKKKFNGLYVESLVGGEGLNENLKIVSKEVRRIIIKAMSLDPSIGSGEKQALRTPVTSEVTSIISARTGEPYRSSITGPSRRMNERFDTR